MSLLALLNLALEKAPRPERVAFLKAQPFAHRGLHGRDAPENSRAAFAAAAALGHGMELDVQLTAQGEPVVFHDETLERLTAMKGRLDDLSEDELAELTLRGSHETIPYLSEVLGLIGGRVPILIELKSIAESNINIICLAVRRALEGYRGDVGVMSFDPRVPGWFGEHAERVPRGLVMTQTRADKRLDRLKSGAQIGLALRAAKPDFIAYDIDYLAEPIPQALRQHGLPVLTWTVRTAAQERRALDYADEMIYEKPVR